MDMYQPYLDLSGVILYQHPFQFFMRSNVLCLGGDQILHDWLRTTDAWTLTKEHFYTQFEMSFFDVSLPPSLAWVTSDHTLKCIETVFATEFHIKGFQTTGITAHLLQNGHTIGIHNDYLEGEETHRLIIQVNPGWQENNGGFLMLFNSDRSSDVAKVIKPINNSCFGFEISPNSFHAVSTVHNYSRYTLVYSFKAY